MRDTTEDANGGTPPEPPMTILAISGSYWLYEGEDLLNDLLFGTGTWPFPVRCVYFKDNIELRRILGPDFVISTLWRINPDVIDRLKREQFLIEEYASDI